MHAVLEVRACDMLPVAALVRNAMETAVLTEGESIALPVNVKFGRELGSLQPVVVTTDTRAVVVTGDH